MRLVSFVYEGELRLGAIKEEPSGEQIVVDLNRANPRLPQEIIGFLSLGDQARVLASEALLAVPPSAAMSLSRVQLKAPIPKPGKIICIGLNYLDHAIESAERSIPQAGFVLPRRGAHWHSSNQEPSVEQKRLARSLGIVEYEDMTKGRLSDEISIVFAARVLDAAVRG